MHFPLPKANQQPFESADSSSEQLYALHAPAIFAYVRLYVASREVAEDLVIDVFLSALAHSDLLARSTEIQRAWLRKVVASLLAWSMLRRRCTRMRRSHRNNQRFCTRHTNRS